jgi:hypothetical protein
MLVPNAKPLDHQEKTEESNAKIHESTLKAFLIGEQANF